MPSSVSQIVWDSEENYTNETYWKIHPLFVLIQEGDRDKLQESLDLQLDRYDFRERISKDKRKQLEFMAVSLVNAFMIAAIQGGVYPPEANWIADRALRRILAMHGPQELHSIIYDAALELCDKVRESAAENTGNPHVENARHYILTHLTQEITVSDISEAAGLSSSHLSRLFRSITGRTLMEYLTDERIRAAKSLLASSDMTIPEIAALLRFCDQSHFTYIFRKKTGLTPGKYRSSSVV